MTTPAESSLDEANRRGQDCANGHLGIELIEAGPLHGEERPDPVIHRRRLA